MRRAGWATVLATVCGCGTQGWAVTPLNEGNKSEETWSFSDTNYRFAPLDDGGERLTVALVDWDGEACDAIDGVPVNRSLVLVVESSVDAPFSFGGLNTVRTMQYQGLITEYTEEGSVVGPANLGMTLTAYDGEDQLEGVFDSSPGASGMDWYQGFFSARSCE